MINDYQQKETVDKASNFVVLTNKVEFPFNQYEEYENPLQLKNKQYGQKYEDRNIIIMGSELEVCQQKGVYINWKWFENNFNVGDDSLIISDNYILKTTLTAYELELLQNLKGKDVSTTITKHLDKIKHKQEYYIQCCKKCDCEYKKELKILLGYYSIISILNAKKFDIIEQQLLPVLQEKLIDNCYSLKVLKSYYEQVVLKHEEKQKLEGIMNDKFHQMFNFKLNELWSMIGEKKMFLSGFFTYQCMLEYLTTKPTEPEIVTVYIHSQSPKDTVQEEQTKQQLIKNGFREKFTDNGKYFILQKEGPNKKQYKLEIQYLNYSLLIGTLDEQHILNNEINTCQSQRAKDVYLQNQQYIQFTTVRLYPDELIVQKFKDVELKQFYLTNEDCPLLTNCIFRETNEIGNLMPMNVRTQFLNNTFGSSSVCFNNLFDFVYKNRISQFLQVEFGVKTSIVREIIRELKQKTYIPNPLLDLIYNQTDEIYNKEKILQYIQALQNFEVLLKQHEKFKEVRQIKTKFYNNVIMNKKIGQSFYYDNKNEQLSEQFIMALEMIAAYRQNIFFGLQRYFFDFKLQHKLHSFQTKQQIDRYDDVFKVGVRTFPQQMIPNKTKEVDQLIQILTKLSDDEYKLYNLKQIAAL